MKKKILLPIFTLAFFACLVFAAVIPARTNASAEEINIPSSEIVAESLQLKDNVYILYAVDFKGTQSTDTTGLLVWDAPQVEYTYNNANTVLTSSKTVTIDSVDYKAFTYTELSAKQMTDVVYASAYVKRDGAYYYSDVKKYSVLEYAYNKLGLTEAVPTEDDSLQALLKAMLAYGSAAQTHFDYKTDNLASAEDFTYVRIANAKFEDGFNYGLFKTGSTVTVTPDEGYGLLASGSTIFTENTNGTLTLTVPADKTIDESSIAKKLNYAYNAENQTYTVTGYTGTQTTVYIPKTYDDGVNGEKKVGSINENAFLDANITTIYNYSDVVIDDTSKTTYGISESATVYTYKIVDGFTVKIGKTEDTVIDYNGTETAVTLPLSFFDGKLYTIADGVFSGSGITEVYNHGVLNIKDNKAKYGLSTSVAVFGRKITATGIVYIEGETSDTVIGFGADSSRIILPNSFTAGKPYTIKSEAFKNNDNLQVIAFGTGLTAIGDNAFDGCDSLTAIYNASDLEIDVTNNTYGIRSGANVYASIVYNGLVVTVGETEDVVVGYDGMATDLVFPDYFIEGHTYSIASEAFYYEATSLSCNCRITSVTFGKGLTSIANRAFYYCRELTTINFAENGELTSIDNRSFMGCSALVNVNFAENGKIETIGELAFNGCDRLTAIVIPDSVKTIGSQAFMNCKSLVSVTLGTGLTAIGENAFENTSKLIELINLSQTLTVQSGEYGLGGSVIVKTENNSAIVKQGDYLFYSDTQTDAETGTEITKHYLVGYLGNDSELTLPSYVYNGVAVDYEIFKYAFYGYNKLEKITIPNCVTAIGAYAFNGGNISRLYYLTEVAFEENSKLTYVGECAFEYCSALTYFTIPSEVTAIGYRAFSGCYSISEIINLSSLPIEKGSTDYGEVAYYALAIVNNNENASKFDENGYKFMTIDGQNYLICYNGSDSELTLPADYNGETYAVYDSAFYGNTGITSVFIPNNVTSIGDEAFSHCVNLKKVVFGANSKLETIKAAAFSCCFSLTEITIPASVKTIGTWAFGDNRSLIYFGFESGSLLTDFGENNPFYCSPSLTVVDLSECNYLTHLPGGSFSDCTVLTKITFPDNLTSIDSTGLSQVTSLICTEYENAYYIGSKNNPYMFLVRVKDTTVDYFEIHEDTKFIVEYAFYGYEELYDIYIPSNVVYIGYGAFSGCSNLSFIRNESGVDLWANRYNLGISHLEYKDIDWIH